MWDDRNYPPREVQGFYKQDELQRIAVSVDMLDTGIDVPECINLVFFKRVRSKTKFWQMIGRGTRLCPDLFGPGQDKEFFNVFDFCENLEYFGNNPEGVEASVQEGVKTKIFRRRLALIDLLARMPKPDESLVQLRTEIADVLPRDVVQMNPDSFVVRPHRRYVEKFSQRDAWNELRPGDFADASNHLADLPTPDDGDEFARRFDLLLLNLQLGVLESSPFVPRWQQQVCEIAGGLEEKEAIPAVKMHMALIQELQTDEFWQDITLPMLENVRRKLRSLIQFLDRDGKRDNVYTNFEDELGQAQTVDGLVKRDDSLKNYRLKVERFVREHEDHPTISRLKHNQPITAADLEALEAILFPAEAAGERERFQQTYGTDKPLGKLIREIVGLDPNAAKQAFAQFLSVGTLNADQITFINQIIDHLVHNGDVFDAIGTEWEPEMSAASSETLSDEEHRLIRLFRCMSTGEQSELLVQAAVVLMRRLSIDPHFHEPEPKANEEFALTTDDRVRKVWPPDWLGKQLVEFDDLGDPGAFLDQEFVDPAENILGASIGAPRGITERHRAKLETGDDLQTAGKRRETQKTSGSAANHGTAEVDDTRLELVTSTMSNRRCV